MKRAPDLPNGEVGVFLFTIFGLIDKQGEIVYDSFDNRSLTTEESIYGNDRGHE